jgi:hypothetical protein
MFVLLESNKKCGLSHYFFEIGAAKVGILYYNDILKHNFKTFKSTLS